MSEYNRLVAENLSLRRNLVATATELKRLLAAVDQGLTPGDVGLAVQTVEDLNEHLRACPVNMCRQGHPEVRYSVGEECPACRLRRYPFHVYPGSEKMDLGPKGEPQVLCQSENQAKHMVTFWEYAGYYEEVQHG